MKIKYSYLILVILLLILIINFSTTLVGIKKNEVMIDDYWINNLEKNSNDVELDRNLTQEEAKLKALELLEEYFDIKLYLSEIYTQVDFIEAKELKNKLTKYEYLNIDSILETGIYQINFSKKEEENRAYYFLRINAKTGELIEYSNLFDMYPINVEKKQIDNEQLINLINSFFEKNQILKVKNKHTRNIKQNSEFDGRFKLFEVVDTENTVTIFMDSYTGKIVTFLLGHRV